MLSLEYDVSVDDLLAFNFRVIRHSAVIGLLIWLVLEILTLVTYFSSGSWAGAVMMFIITSAFFILIPLSLLFPKAVAYTTSIFAILFMLYLTFATNLQTALAMYVPLVLLILSSGYGLGVARLYRGNNNMIGKHALTISEAGAIEKTPNSESHYEWSAVTGIEEDGRNMYLFLGRMKAFVIPKSTASVKSDIFLAQARVYLQNSNRLTKEATA